VLNLYGHCRWKMLTLRAGFWNTLNEDYRYHGSGVNGAGRDGGSGGGILKADLCPAGAGVVLKINCF
jgi:hypothetical protein